MDREHLTDTVKDHLKDHVQDNLKQSALEALKSEADEIGQSTPTSQEAYKANPKIETIMQLFQHSFSETDCKHLGLQKISFQTGKWYVPWDSGSFTTDLTPEETLGDAKRTRPSYLDAAQTSWRALQTYLKNKTKRRKDDSLLAAPYKTLLAKLIHKSVERIELLKEPTERRRYYQKLLNFLEAIWIEPTLINPSRRHDEQGDQEAHHVEHFIYQQRKLVEQQLAFLPASGQPSSSLTEWLKQWDEELVAIHICGARAFHYLLQPQTIPDNLEAELRNFGNTYHRLMLGECLTEKAAPTALRIKIKESPHWREVSKRAQQKLQRMKVVVSDQSLMSLLPQVNAGRLTLEEAVFYQVGETFTADQCLYLALYGTPDALGLSQGQFQEYFGHTTFLKLYRTDVPQVGFQWLQWHIQQASDRLLPDLEVLAQSDEEKSERFQRHLRRLLHHLQQLANPELTCPSLEMGILPSLVHLEGCPQNLLSRFQIHLSQLQQQLHHLVLVRALLAQYRALMPQLGEPIGKLALRQDLILLAGIVQNTLSEMQTQLATLNPLFGMGYSVELDSSQQPILTQQPGLLTVVDDQKKPSPALMAWRKHHAARVTQVGALSQRISEGEMLTRQAQMHTSLSGIRPAAKQAERQFRLARVMVLTSFSQHITDEQAQKLEAGDKMISAWRQVVDAGVEEQKRLETKSARPSLLIHKKTNNPKQQSYLPLAPKQSTSASDHKHEQKEQLQGVVNSIALQGISCLQASTPEEFTQSWQALMAQERESFYKQFERYYLASEETQWVLYFQNTIGIFFQPLPSLTQPWPAWWFKHATQNRNLLFEAWCLSSVVTILEDNPHVLTNAQKQHFSGWLQQQQIKTRENHRARWGWLDSSRYGLKRKYQYWELQLTHFQKTIMTASRVKEVIEEKKEIVQQKLDPPAPRKEFQVSPTPSTAPPSHASSVLTVSPQENHDGLEGCPLDLKMNSSAWQHYVESLSQIELARKELLCLTFLKTAIDRLKQAQMSLETPEHAAIFYAVTHLFWLQFSTQSHWLFNPLDAIHNTLDAKSQQSPSVKQRFFTLQAERALKFASEKSDIAQSQTDPLTHTF